MVKSGKFIQIEDFVSAELIVQPPNSPIVQPEAVAIDDEMAGKASEPEPMIDQ